MSKNARSSFWVSSLSICLPVQSLDYDSTSHRIYYTQGSHLFYLVSECSHHVWSEQAHIHWIKILDTPIKDSTLLAIAFEDSFRILWIGKETIRSFCLFKVQDERVMDLVLVDKDVLYGITAHGAIFSLILIRCQTVMSSSHATIVESFIRHPDKSLYYSAKLFDLSNVLYAMMGTIFEGVRLIKLKDNKVLAEERCCSAHAGSVFDVNLLLVKEKDSIILASCSDDRTVVINNLYSTHSHHCQRMFGHLARCWRVKLLQIQNSMTVAVSCGEDSACRVWDIATGKGLTKCSFECGRAGMISMHAAYDKSSNAIVVLLGGYDGSISRWSIKEEQFLSTSSRVREHKVPIEAKNFCFIAISAGIDDSMSLIHGVWTMSPMGNLYSPSGQLIHQEAEAWKHYTCMTYQYSGAPFNVLSLLIGDLKGRLWTVQIEIAKDNKKCLNLEETNPTTTTVISSVQFEKLSDSKIAIIRPLEDGSIIVQDALGTVFICKRCDKKDSRFIRELAVATLDAPLTSLCLINGFLVIGTRRGELIQVRVQPLDDIHHIEKRSKSISKDALTSITVSNEHTLQVTDRGGRVYSISLHFGQELSVISTTKIISEGTLEGFIISSPSQTSWLYYGFHGKCFVTWNVQGQILKSIPCAGQHRLWTFQGSVFAFLREGRVFYVNDESDKDQCLASSDSLTVLRQGWHWRETRASLSFNNGINDSSFLVVTGGDDGSLGLLHGFPSNCKQLQMLRSPASHHTSSIKCLSKLEIKVTDCPLFLAGGSAGEVSLWKIMSKDGCLQHIPSTFCEDRNSSVHGQRTSSAADPFALVDRDLRIMSLDAHLLAQDGQTRFCTNVLVGCSDGDIHLFDLELTLDSITPSAKWKSLSTMRVPSRLIDNTLREWQFCIQHLRFLFHGRAALVAGTDGYCHFFARQSSSSLEYLQSMQFHSAGINALSIQSTSFDQQKILILTGGDDQRLALYELQFISEKGERLGQISADCLALLDNAHLASINGVILVSTMDKDEKSDNDDGNVAKNVMQAFSVGNDKRLNHYFLVRDKKSTFSKYQFILNYEPRRIEVADVSTVAMSSDSLFIGGVGYQCLDYMLT